MHINSDRYTERSSQIAPFLAAALLQRDDVHNQRHDDAVPKQDTAGEELSVPSVMAGHHHTTPKGRYPFADCEQTTSASA